MSDLISLTSKLTNPTLVKDEKLRAICTQAASRITGADRVSLWVFDNDFNEMHSIMCFDTRLKEFSNGHTIYRNDCRAYFKGILNNEIIRAPDARNHRLTSCFNELYFKPLNIYSLLDYILHQDFEPVGVICCESVDKITQWTDQDEEVLRKIARASSMHFSLT
ncbi:GAF domain-containing protein [Thalassotalea ganghwensis]